MIKAVKSGDVLLDQSVNKGMFSFDPHILTRVFLLVIAGSPKDFLTVNVVCKEWRRIATGKEFSQELRQSIEPEIFGGADFLKYIGGDSGDELPIPLEYLVRFKRGQTLLTFTPSSLTFPTRVEPCTLPNMGKWASSAKGDYQVGYDPHSWEEAIQEERSIEEAHWTFIDIRVIQKGKSFTDQRKAVGDRGKKLAVLSDLCLSLLMAYVKTGVKHIKWKSRNAQWARVPDTAMGWRLSVAFSSSGLWIDCRCDSLACDIIGVVIAQKSFGIKSKSSLFFFSDLCNLL